MALYIVATPIGNLEDMTYRAVRVLSEVGGVVSEDTRRTGLLLKHYNIPKKEFISFNDHNAKRQTPKIIELLLEGKDIAFTSDAGTPGISDPGFYLIREAVANNIQIVPIPGAVAAINGLIGSGLPIDKFFFYGFLPKTSGKKLDALKLSNDFTVAYYESPHRIKKTLELLSKEMPEVNVCVARELTKKFEEFIRGKPEEILKVADKIKGEIVLILSSK
ncbi:16S rRNA (cytidine(1402)-2'-O)-methyltransferase [Candidatus Woesearchaeota archaeon]|nr:MAG: 16S rRNA (cytidine(1402)-2'-O)-methyltransferase [Candidatus Woesearchaeota archaeon]